MAERERGRGYSRPGLRLTGPLGVVTVGLVLALVGAAGGISCSVRIPTTEANLSAGGSIGDKNLDRAALPSYLSSRLGLNNDFLNFSHTTTIWIAEGTGIFVAGNQEVPLVDIQATFITNDNVYQLGLNGFRYTSRRGR